MIFTHDKECEEYSEACGCNSRYELIVMIENLRVWLIYMLKYNGDNDFLNAREMIKNRLNESDLSIWRSEYD